VDRIDDAAVGSVGEGGDVFVDGLEGVVEVLGASGWQGTTPRNEANQRAELDDPVKAAAGTGANHCLDPGWGPV